MKASSALVNTLPVGFIGVLSRMALVRGPNAAANSARGRSHFGGSRRTMRGTAPSVRMTGRYVSYSGSMTTTSSPGSSSAMRLAVIASVAPEVTTTSVVGSASMP